MLLHLVVEEEVVRQAGKREVEEENANKGDGVEREALSEEGEHHKSSAFDDRETNTQSLTGASGRDPMRSRPGGSLGRRS